MFITESSKFIERDTIPNEGILTYDNGFYVNVVSIYTDIVNSSQLLEGRYRPTVAAIYREFIAATVRIMNRMSKYITIQGDCVGGVFEFNNNMDELADIAVDLDKLQEDLSFKYVNKYIDFSAGIGMSYGRALMIKVGLKGTGINDIVWVGDVVNEACHLCNQASRNGNNSILVSDEVYKRLSYDYRYKNLIGCR